MKTKPNYHAIATNNARVIEGFSSNLTDRNKVIDEAKLLYDEALTKTESTNRLTLNDPSLISKMLLNLIRHNKHYKKNPVIGAQLIYNVAFKKCTTSKRILIKDYEVNRTLLSNILCNREAIRDRIENELQSIKDTNNLYFLNRFFNNLNLNKKIIK